MQNPTSSAAPRLGLRAGDWVEVRAAEEILATLDDRGRLDALPFMPEMLQFCGKRFRVHKTAHKTCDTVKTYRGLVLDNAVHLEGLRCDGQAHGGCQAGCLLFWRENWLRRTDGPASETTAPPAEAAAPMKRTCNVAALMRATRAGASAADDSEERYACQATDLLNFTERVYWWDPRPYIKDLTSGNVRLGDFVRYILFAVFNAFMRIVRRDPNYPQVSGLATGKTPVQKLNLKPGELVQVCSREEILRTLNAGRKNRGLWFDVEMEPHCGKTYRVLTRVERIVDEKTGKMLNIPNDCIILDGVACSGCLSRERLFCPRSIYPYWREIWLKRVG